MFAHLWTNTFHWKTKMVKINAVVSSHGLSKKHALHFKYIDVLHITGHNKKNVRSTFKKFVNWKQKLSTHLHLHFSSAKDQSEGVLHLQLLSFLHLLCLLQVHKAHQQQLFVCFLFHCIKATEEKYLISLVFLKEK